MTLALLLEEVVSICSRFDIVPTVYASYAITQVVDCALPVRDLDILLPDEVFAERHAFITAFEEAGYELISGVVLTLRKQGLDVEFSPYSYWNQKCDFDATKDQPLKHTASAKRLGVQNLIHLYSYLLNDPTRLESKKTQDFTKLQVLHHAYEQGLR